MPDTAAEENVNEGDLVDFGNWAGECPLDFVTQRRGHHLVGIDQQDPVPLAVVDDDVFLRPVAEPVLV